MNVLFPDNHFSHLYFTFSQILLPNCVLMTSFPSPGFLAASASLKKYVHVFTVLALLVLLKLVACMHAQTHTNPHRGALKWKRPEALYLAYIIHPPQHKQHMTGMHGKTTHTHTQRGEERMKSALKMMISTSRSFTHIQLSTIYVIAHYYPSFIVFFLSLWNLSLHPKLISSLCARAASKPRSSKQSRMSQKVRWHPDGTSAAKTAPGCSSNPNTTYSTSVAKMLSGALSRRPTSGSCLQWPTCPKWEIKITDKLGLA